MCFQPFTRKWPILLAAALLVAACSNGDNGPEGGKGYALAIGLNRVDPAQYNGWDGALTGCEPDANDMADIARGQGFETTVLLTEDAKRDAVLAKLKGYAEKLESGDLLVVSYSGHGGNVPDQNGDESDLLDETWILYDGQLLDDELAQAWSRFREGVRILLLSDSCHSGTVLKYGPKDFDDPPPARREALATRWRELRIPRIANRAAILAHPRMIEAVRTRPELRDLLERSKDRPPFVEGEAPPAEDEPDIFTVRSMPFAVAVTTHNAKRAFYERIGKAAPKESEVDIKASVILISGCEDDQYSADLGFNGLFTWRLKDVWASGAFQGSHRDFHREILEAVSGDNPHQTPDYNVAGKENPEFEEARPYTPGERR
jgi:hypothetical protein